MEAAVQILDTTLRDGSYVIDFQFTADDTALLVSALDSAGIPLIEIGHGLGLGAARSGEGDQAATDEAYIRAAAHVVRDAKIGAFFIPGIGTEDDLKRAAGLGLGFIRIGTNVTELAKAEPYIRQAKALGLWVSCNLMKSYALPPDEFGKLGHMAEEFGADLLCLVDSAGGMMPEDVRAYLEAVRNESEIALGFHGHNNLCLAVANVLEALDAGATVLDGSLQGMGRSEGNAPTEIVAAVLQKRGHAKEVDVHGLLDIGEGFVRPLLGGKGYSSLGITTGRALFHSSFLSRVLKAATEYGIDPRDLIMRLGDHDRVNAPDNLVRKLAGDIAAAAPRKPIRIDIAATTASAPKDFLDQVSERASELKQLARKHALPAVFNVVVTPYEMTRVSPYVETSYGCAMTNVMLADGALLPGVLATIDAFSDYILLDPMDTPLAPGAVEKATLFLYSDHEMWAAATVTQVSLLLERRLRDRAIAMAGVPPLAGRAAFAFAEAGARVYLDAPLAEVLGMGLDELRNLSFAPLDEAAADLDAVVCLSPRRPDVSTELVKRIRPGGLLFDGGIGSLAPETLPVAEARGVRVVRVDLRPSLAARALEHIGMERVVSTHMGRATWGSVSVVAGGLIGREGDVIVDSIALPTRIIGIADGQGGILTPESEDPDAFRVRKVIAEKRLAPRTESRE